MSHFISIENIVFAVFCNYLLGLLLRFLLKVAITLNDKNQRERANKTKVRILYHLKIYMY